MANLRTENWVTNQSIDRLQIKQLNHASPTVHSDDGKAVIQGLTQVPKSLPPRYFYDDKGSLLFEQICELPEYYPTRTEAWILKQYADEIAQITGACELVELGSGSSTKTRSLLDAYARSGYPLYYIPIDVSGGILEASACQLGQDYETLHLCALVGTYEQALAQLEPTQLPSRLVFFLGSSIGNFSPEEYEAFLDQIIAALRPGEYFLLGVDLRKSIETLEAAYNDAQQLTAQFNLNILDHLNWRFEGNFKTENFEHYAFYNTSLHQIEMHLRCLKAHRVNLAKLDLDLAFAPGETILTEISRKFDLDLTQGQLQEKGLFPLKVWTDPQHWFGLILCRSGKGL
jgi:dimethylhistidine N-methyltransferase